MMSNSFLLLFRFSLFFLIKQRAFALLFSSSFSFALFIDTYVQCAYVFLERKTIFHFVFTCFFHAAKKQQKSHVKTSILLQSMTTKMLSSRLVVSYKYIVSNMCSNSGFVDKKNDVAFEKIIAKVDCSIE